MAVILCSTMPSVQIIVTDFSGVSIDLTYAILVVGLISILGTLYLFRFIYQGAVQSQRIPQYCLNNWIRFKKTLAKVIDLLSI